VKERTQISHITQGSRSRAQEYMETSLMSESVVDTSDVEETVTQEHVEIQLGYDQGSLSKWHNFLRRTFRDVFGAAGPIF
jgi:hypothetical protein